MAFGGNRQQQLQKGLREYLLCHECEQRLCKWERYGSQVLIYQEGVDVSQDGNWTTFRNIEYPLFKLFLMSMLWRISISSLHQFSQVTLRDIDNERMRSMLLNGDPGTPTDYGCSILFLPDHRHYRHLHLPQTTVRGNLTTRWFVAPCLLFQYPFLDGSAVEESHQHTLDYVFSSMVTVEGTLCFDQMPYTEFVRQFTNWKDVLGEDAG